MPDCLGAANESKNRSSLMKNKLQAGAIAVLLLAVGIGAEAQRSVARTRFSGMFDTYTPQSTSNNVTTGPYEIHGPWSVVLTANSHANFFAAVNMGLTDGWAITQNGGNFDPAARGPHTHHITLLNGTVTTLATGGIEITGSATITVNGSAAPISPSDVVIDITGGSDVAYSNITLTFAAPGSKHFGSEPLQGFVRRGTK
jgi:hypothetical protein